ncbi:iron-sulfur cluster assembly protein [Blattabacterium cuenoti]|uniref:iron-sulfur cluster assembly protein n=1 Tax=Blattabacterium cuenoti TaxID=1653831 RepID=UPI00311E61C7
MNPNYSLENRIISILKTIYDPEISVDIYELGLIYDVQISGKNKVKIVMTLTTPNCPVAESLPLEVKEKVQSIIQEIKEVDVILTFDPPWSREFMSDEARLELGLL